MTVYVSRDVFCFNQLECWFQNMSLLGVQGGSRTHPELSPSTDMKLVEDGSTLRVFCVDCLVLINRFRLLSIERNAPLAGPLGWVMPTILKSA